MLSLVINFILYFSGINKYSKQSCRIFCIIIYFLSSEKIKLICLDLIIINFHKLRFEMNFWNNVNTCNCDYATNSSAVDKSITPSSTGSIKITWWQQLYKFVDESAMEALVCLREMMDQCTRWLDVFFSPNSKGLIDERVKQLVKIRANEYLIPIKLVFVISLY